MTDVWSLRELGRDLARIAEHWAEEKYELDPRESWPPDELAIELVYVIQQWIESHREEPTKEPA